MIAEQNIGFLEVATRVFVLEGGRIRFSGTVAEMTDNEALRPRLFRTEVMRTIRIGSGAGYSGDRIEPAVELAEKGDIHYLVFECLGERTVALAQQARMKDPESGYDPLLEERMRAVLPICAAKGIKIVTNMGAANPGSRGEEDCRNRDVARAHLAQDRRHRRGRRARRLQGRRSCDHGIRRHHRNSSATGCCRPTPISVPSRWRTRYVAARMS